MEITCADVVDDGCHVVVTGTTAHHLAAEIVAHTGDAHPSPVGSSDDEVNRHHARVLHRIEDMLAGGRGTPV